MVVTNGLIVYAWVQAYILENDNFVLMGLLWAIYIATLVYSLEPMKEESTSIVITCTQRCGNRFIG